MDKMKDKELLGEEDEGIRKIQIASPRNLTALQDMIEDAAFKVAFIEDIFSMCDGYEPFSKCGAVGFNHVLRNLREELDFVVRELCERRNKGLIIEKEAK